VESLTERYGTTAAVTGLNFEIREGEIFGLLGQAFNLKLRRGSAAPTF
jgi:ABC-type multidrug transport system ATPase subunit